MIMSLLKIKHHITISADLTNGSSGIQVHFMLLKIMKKKRKKYLACSYFLSNCFNVVTQFKSHIIMEQSCLYGNRYAIRTTLRNTSFVQTVCEVVPIV